MRTIPRFLSLLTLLLLSDTSRAAEKPAADFDPAARAKAIAPFIDEQTVAVIHADLSRLDLRPAFEQLIEQVPEARIELGVASLAAQGAIGTLAKAGIKDAYVVVSLADIPLGPPHKPPFLVFPLGEGADEYTLATLLGPVSEYEVKQRVDNVFFAGSRAALERYKKGKPEGRPELCAAFEAAGDTAIQAVVLPPKYSRRVIEEMMPELPPPIGGSSKILTDGILWAAVGVDLPWAMSIRVVIQSKDQAAAAALKAKWTDACRVARKDVGKADWLETFDALVALLTPEARDGQLTLVLDQKNRGIERLMAALKPLVEDCRNQARQSIAVSNLRQIGMAMQCYQDARKTFPAAASHDAGGKPLLSWRVHLLPYIGEQKLYEQFRLNEPWDSEHNRTLIGKMPAIYGSPRSPGKEKGRTMYLIPLGKDTWFSGREGPASKDIKRADRAIMVVEADDEHAVVWTKPEDLAFDPENPTKGLGVDAHRGFLALFFDGHVEQFDKQTDAKALRAMCTRDAK